MNHNQLKIIAPPHYKCETVTLEKNKGIEKINEALKLIEKYIKEKQGVFKLVNPPILIGAKDEKDIEDIIAIHDDKEILSSQEEDNEEGMDFNLEGEEVEEEAKDEKKKTKKVKQFSDDEDSDDN